MASQDRIPDKLGPYRLQERLGEGGMGAVYLARDRERRPVAVKVLHSRVAAEPTSRRRLAREVEAMRRVRSPFVAQVTDADVTGKFPYVVTRYVPGQTLDHTVRQQGPLAPAGLERLARGLAQALVAIHAAGVVHRDLKPGNVMLHDGDPVVIDFGIAYTGDSTQLTQTGMFMGTPGYLAPEVIEGQQSSAASDVHSWGATLAFAATGRPPFGSGSFENVFYRIVQGHADIDGIPAPLAQLVAASLSRDPRRRPTADWLCAQTGAPGLAAGPPMLTGAAQAATLAPRGDAARGAASVNGAGVNGAGALNAAGVNGAGAYAGGAAPYAAPGAALAQGAQVGGLSPRGLNTGAPYQSTPELARALPQPVRPQPIRPGDYADVLPPVQYAPPGAYAPARPGPYGPGPYGNGNGNGDGNGYPAAPGQDTAARPGAPRTADGGASRAQPLPFMGLALIVAAVALTVLLPVAGVIGSLIVITLLRAADRSSSALSVRRSARGPSVTDVVVGVLTAPWAIARSVLTTVLVAPLAAVVAGVVFVATEVATSADSVLMASGYAAGAAVALYGLGPGSAGPRREVTRIVRAVARNRVSAVVAALVLYCLAAATVAEALSQPPVYWPDISSWLPHLPNVNTMLHLPHLGLPHFGVGRSQLG
ncbi:MAG TPA: serine/threonine-protein kinase [Streptosporangiaceae bacterium]|jgi:predicted Ser/Thr protein kinase|nr:serine/threonine-protein kinase [Streptosporangiaceae bacterium]